MTDSFIRLPPDSTGKRTFTVEHDVSGTPVQVPLQHIADPNNADQRLLIDDKGAASVTFSDGQPILGAFGGLKITNVRSIGVYESSLEANSDLFSVVEENGGEEIYNSSQPYITLSVTNQNNSRVCKTTNRYHHYLPGTANVTLLSLNPGGSGKTNNVRRWGLFDDLDGLFFQLDENGLSVVIRSSVSGSVEEEIIPSSDWVGVFDQTQIANEVSLDAAMVWWIDYQWLGAGRVRFGIFSADGKRIVLHTFENAGNHPVPYMRTGTLPVRYENLNTGVTSSATQMLEICGAVYCEGDFEDYAFWRFQSDIFEKTVSELTPLVSIRSLNEINGKPNPIQAYPETISVYSDSPVAVHFYFQDEDNDMPDPTQWISSITDCSLEFNKDDTFTLMNDGKFRTIFSEGAMTHDVSSFFEINDEGITRNNFNQFFAVAVEPLDTGSNATVKVTMGVRELR